MESQPQNPEFRNNPENFHPCLAVHEGLSLTLCMLGNCPCFCFHHMTFFKINFFKIYFFH